MTTGTWLVTGTALISVVFLTALGERAWPVASARLGQGGIPVDVKQTGHCSVLAPRDWHLSTNPQGSTAEAQSRDKRMYAGWGVVAINRAMHPYYGDLYGDPETSIRVLTGMIVTGSMSDPSGIRYTSAPEPFLHDFLRRSFESARHAGLVFYQIYPGASPQTYVESVYWAIADRALGAAGVQIAAGVAVSLRCVTHAIPVPYEPPQASGQGKRAGCGYGGHLRGYQKELGSQYAHSPATGQNFLLDATTDWQEAGPEGPGYYRSIDGGHRSEKLALGRDDDC